MVFIEYPAFKYDFLSCVKLKLSVLAIYQRH